MTNPAGRFEPRRVDFSDNADDDAGPAAAVRPTAPTGFAGEEGDPPANPATTVTPEITRGILCRNDSPDIPFEQSINPYKGCEHGCTYCFARPSHAFLGLSPGLDFETRIQSKPGAAQALRRELARPAYRCRVIALGANTDPYQPAEATERITRGVLETLDECSHPVAIVTKSGRILRDLDLLEGMARRNLVHVFVSITTLDPALARSMEPRAASPARRLRTVRALSAAGVPVGVLVSPVIPGLTDPEIESIVATAAEAGASWAGTILLRLPGELQEIFVDWLEEAYPTKARRVISLIRQTRGGRMYEGTFGRRMRGTGAYADMIRTRFRAACRRHGLDGAPEPLDTSRFSPPPPAREAGGQLTLFPADAAP